MSAEVLKEVCEMAGATSIELRYARQTGKWCVVLQRSGQYTRDLVPGTMQPNAEAAVAACFRAFEEAMNDGT